MKNLSFVAFNDSKGVSRTNFTIAFLFDIEKLVINFILKAKANEVLKEYDLLLLRGSIDTCKASQGNVGNYLMRFLMENFKNHGNVPLTCPHPKGFYYLCNLPTPEESKIPGFFPHTKGQWEITFVAKARSLKSAKLAQIFSFKIRGISFA